MCATIQWVTRRIPGPSAWYHTQAWAGTGYVSPSSASNVNVDRAFSRYTNAARSDSTPPGCTNQRTWRL